MTNEQIIFNARVDLLENGIIGTTGRQIQVEDAEGNKQMLDEPEQIHTYAGWKTLCFQVRRGEHAVANFQIWKHTTKKLNAEADTAEATADEQEFMFLTKEFFLTASQVEQIAE